MIDDLINLSFSLNLRHNFDLLSLIIYMFFYLFSVFVFFRGCRVSELDFGNTLSIGWIQKYHHSSSSSSTTNQSDEMMNDEDKNRKYYALIQPGIILHNHQSTSQSEEEGESKKFSTSNWNIFNKGTNSNKSQSRLKRDESRYSPTLLGLVFSHIFLTIFFIFFSFYFSSSFSPFHLFIHLISSQFFILFILFFV